MRGVATHRRAFWATQALDTVRRTVWNKLRKTGQKKRAKAMKGARWALWKNYGDLNEKQQATLAAIEVDSVPAAGASVTRA